MDTHLQAFFKKLLDLPGTIIQSYSLEISYKGLNYFRKKKREDSCTVRIIKYLLKTPLIIPLIIKPLFPYPFIMQMPFCIQLNSSCICPILKGKAVSTHGSTTQRNGQTSPLGQGVVNLKGTLHPSCTVEFTSCSHIERVPGFGSMSRGQWISYLINLMARVFLGEKVVPERVQPISTPKLRLHPCFCKREVSPVLQYLKASNSAALEGPLF